MKAKKKYGQNFLKDEKYINCIINECNVTNETIIEIGPGQGILTKRLKEKNTNLYAYEIDADLKPYLQPLEDEKTHIIYEDFLKINQLPVQKNIIIVGNLPYYITTPLISHIIDLNIEINKMIIMVQKEVADRFLAKPNTKEYGYFTLYLKYYFDISKITDVPNYAFNPIPKVESTILKFTSRKNKPNIDINKYKKLLMDSFNQKRKTLKNNLQNYNFNLIKEVLDKHNLSKLSRAEELPEEIFIELYYKLEQFL